MAARKKRSSAEVDALLEEMLVDAYGDDEQLTALAEGVGDALDFPIDVHVVGEPLSLLAADYDGNARRRSTTTSPAAFWSTAFCDSRAFPADTSVSWDSAASVVGSVQAASVGA